MEEKYLIEKIGYYKLLVTILSTVDIGVIAWFFQNFEKILMIKLIICSYIIGILTVVTIIMNYKTYKTIKLLKGDIV